MPFLSKKKQLIETDIALFARIWEEDGVWNISGIDLPVAVFGDSLEEAKTHFKEAVVAHMDALIELNLIESVLAELHEKHQKCRPVDCLPNEQPIIKLTGRMRDQHFALAV